MWTTWGEGGVHSRSFLWMSIMGNSSWLAVCYKEYLCSKCLNQPRLSAIRWRLSHPGQRMITMPFSYACFEKSFADRVLQTLQVKTIQRFCTSCEKPPSVWLLTSDAELQTLSSVSAVFVASFEPSAKMNAKIQQLKQTKLRKPISKTKSYLKNHNLAMKQIPKCLQQRNHRQIETLP